MSDETLAEKRAVELLHGPFFESHNSVIAAAGLGQDV